MSVIEEARRVLKIEANAILDLCEQLDGAFTNAVNMILNCKGKVIVTGIGKSGQIGRKISSTLSSTGTPSVFLHPAESSHGDLGVISSDDLLVAISYGGESIELNSVITFAARKGIPVIALTGNMQSSLARAGRATLNIAVKEEACPLGLAPTSSSTVTLALGDALAMAVLKERGFREEDFAEFHPGGSLGRRLLTRVQDVMHVGDALPLVNIEQPMAEVIALMTAKEVRGVAGVVDENEKLVGIITDGDIRRRLEKGCNPFEDKASETMSRNPKTIDCSELAQKAVFVMEQFQIQILFVVDSQSSTPNRPVGLIHLQDLLKAKIC